MSHCSEIQARLLLRQFRRTEKQRLISGLHGGQEFGRSNSIEIGQVAPFSKSLEAVAYECPKVTATHGIHFVPSDDVYTCAAGLQVQSFAVVAVVQTQTLPPAGAPPPRTASDENGVARRHG